MCVRQVRQCYCMTTKQRTSHSLYPKRSLWYHNSLEVMCILLWIFLRYLCHSRPWPPKRYVELPCCWIWFNIKIEKKNNNEIFIKIALQSVRNFVVDPDFSIRSSLVVNGNAARCQFSHREITFSLIPLSQKILSVKFSHWLWNGGWLIFIF